MKITANYFAFFAEEKKILIFTNKRQIGVMRLKKIINKSSIQFRNIDITANGVIQPNKKRKNYTDIKL